MKKTILSSLPSTIHILILLSTFIVVFLFCYGVGNSGNSKVMGQTFDKTIFFPQVNVTDNNNQNTTLDEEFIVVNTNASNNFQIPIEIPNPDFGLYPPFVKLVGGQKYTVNSPNDEDIKYNTISVKLAPILSVSSDIKNLTDADPENSNDMTLGKSIDIGHYGAVDVGDIAKENNGSSSSKIFIMPTNLKSGNYILYVYLQYPYGITGVFSNAATVQGLDKK